MKKKQSQRFEVYNHRILWSAAEKNLRMATSSANDTMYYALGGMLLSFFAFEGYLNWLGVRVAPEVWEEERQFFSRSPFQGTLGKYRFLEKMLGVSPHSPSHGPFHTAKKLLEMRNAAVHPRSELGERKVKVANGHFPSMYRGKLENLVSPEKAVKTRKDIETLAEELHEAALIAYPAEVTCQKAFGKTLEFDITDG